MAGRQMNEDIIRALCSKGRAVVHEKIKHQELLYFRDYNAVLHVHQDIVGDMVYGLEQWFAAVPEKKIEIHAKWPRDWWEAFKWRWFPAWLLKRFPVQWQRIDVDQQIYRAICPHVDLATRRAPFTKCYKFLYEHSREAEMVKAQRLFKCTIAGCPRWKPLDAFMCKYHWDMVSPELQERVATAYREHPGGREHVEALDTAIAEVRKQEGPRLNVEDYFLEDDPYRDPGDPDEEDYEEDEEDEETVD